MWRGEGRRVGREVKRRTTSGRGGREYHFILRILPMNYKEEEEGRVRGKRSGGDGAKGEGGAFYPTSLHSPVLCYHPG